jgi:hypothetical protein
VSKDGSKPKRSAKWDLDLQPLKESEARASERIANRLLGRGAAQRIEGRAMEESAMADSSIASREQMEPQQNTMMAESTMVNSAVLAPVSGYTSVPNSILDSVAQAVPPTEFAVYLRLYRLSHESESGECNIGYDRLAKSCHISRRTAQTAVARLERLGLVERTAIGKSFKEASRYRVVIPGKP